MMRKEIIQAFFLGSTTPAENAALAAWLKENPDNREIFEKEYKLFLLCQAADAQSAMTGKARRPSWLLIAGIAAALAGGIFAGVRLLPQKQDGQTVLYCAEAGQSKELALPDGSRVILNSGSSLEYQEDFSGRYRKVRMNGEAVFDVSKDAQHPFIVETYEYRVKVLGTHFDVIADRAQDEFSVALFEGSVEIQDGKGKPLTMLYPNQSVRLEGGRLVRQKVKEKEYLWTEGVISIEGLGFRELMRKMERCYGVNIIIEREDEPVIHYDYLKLRISDGAGQALDALRRRSAFTYTFDSSSNTYHIK